MSDLIKRALITVVSRAFCKCGHVRSQLFSRNRQRLFNYLRLNGVAAQFRGVIVLLSKELREAHMGSPAFRNTKNETPEFYLRVPISTAV